MWMNLFHADTSCDTLSHNVMCAQGWTCAYVRENRAVRVFWPQTPSVSGSLSAANETNCNKKRSEQKKFQTSGTGERRKTRLTERMCTTLMWMSVEVVSGVRIVQWRAIIDDVIDVRIMECHASMDVVIGVRVVLCHQAIDVPLFWIFHFLSKFSSCYQAVAIHHQLFPVAILCPRFAPRKHVILGVLFTHTVGNSRPLSAVNDPSVTSNWIQEILVQKNCSKYCSTSHTVLSVLGSSPSWLS